ncbi:MAG: M20 family metallopeptidase [Microlunatus sp.]|nr:M20 family metallopeptidase [Microlunatus sp.]
MTATFEDELVQLRRRLHQIPELGLDLPQTQAVVLDALADLDLEVSTGQGLSSVVAVLRGRAPDRNGRTVLLRGDMDALPVVETTGEPFAATGSTMHACGHDLHTAGLVGAACLLAARVDELAGDVVFMFQPGEEGCDGAGAMIGEGVLTAAGRRVDAAYGLHVFSNMLPLGVVATRPGPLMASSSGVYVTVRGAGGHGSRPHAAADPIVVAAEMVTSLQTMITRQFDPFDPVVVTVGAFHAGTRRNIIPEIAQFEATVRTLSVASLAQIETATVRLCEHVAEAHGVSAEVRFEAEYPVTVNDAGKTSFALGVAGELFGGERVLELGDPVMGSEDFSRVLAEVPGCFLFLGACPGDPATAPGNHAPDARFDDSVLVDGARLLTELAYAELAR